MKLEPSLMLPGAAARSPSHTVSPAPAQTADAPRFAEALRCMQQGRWQEAFSTCAELADGGHGPAARIALLFAERGTRLFGGRYQASERQRAAWRRIGR